MRFAGRVLDCCGGCAARPGVLELRADAIVGDQPGSEAEPILLGTQAKTLLMPPLANAHDHVRGVRPISIGGFDMPLELWLLYMTGLPAVDPYLVAAAALARQAGGGLGSIMVHYTRPQDASRVGEELAIVARAARDIGVRVAVAVALRDQNPLGYAPDAVLLDRLEPADRALAREKLLQAPVPPAEQVRLVDELADQIGGGLVTVQYGPYGLEWCSDPLLRLVSQRSAATGRRVHMHLLESPLQREYLDHAFPQGPVRYLDEIGLLSPRLSLAHGTQLRPAELELLAERGVIVSVNTSSNLVLRSGVTDMTAMHRHGVRIATGLDGFTMDDDDDALREFRLAYMLHRGRGLDEGMPLGALLQAACQTGREAVSGLTGGPLAAGAPADLLELDYAGFSGDVVVETGEAGLLAHRATRRHIAGMVVAGRQVVRGGVVLGVDLPGIERELDAQVRQGAAEFTSWQQVNARIRARMQDFYAAGLHRCG